MVMPLTPNFYPLDSSQLSPIGTPGHRQNSSSSSSSSRTVIPLTATHPKENVLASQEAATPVGRNRVSQRPNKLRSKLTGLATPFHLDIRHRPQGVLPPRLPPRTFIKGMAKERKRVTNINTVGDKSVIVQSLTTAISQKGDAGYAGSVRLASSLESHMAMITPPYLQVRICCQ